MDRDIFKQSGNFRNWKSSYHLGLFLKDWKTLETVTIIETNVTDAGLEHLAGLKHLRLLQAGRTKVTADGVKKLAAALPGCTIEWDGGTIEPKK